MKRLGGLLLLTLCALLSPHEAVPISGFVARHSVRSLIPIEVRGKERCICKATPLAIVGPTPTPQKDTVTVTFVLPDGEEVVTECSSDTYILDAAEDAGIDLPYACRAGACSACAGKVIQGGPQAVDSSEQSYLTPEQVQQGYVLTCTGYAVDDCTIETHKEMDLH